MAINMYTKAAKANDPHGLFNLAYLMEEGVNIPEYTWKLLDFTEELYNSTDKMIIMTELYQRCRNHNSEESFVPCSLALLRLQFTQIWIKYGILMKLSGGIVLAVVFYITLNVIFSHLGHQHMTQSV
ncbi:protein sel-1 homolog 3-like [Saccoglossus kowalevskii]